MNVYTSFLQIYYYDNLVIIAHLQLFMSITLSIYMIDKYTHYILYHFDKMTFI